MVQHTNTIDNDFTSTLAVYWYQLSQRFIVLFV